MRIWFPIVLLLCWVARASAVAVGDSRDAVLREFGEPASSAVRGETELLVFPGAARVTLRNNLVFALEPLRARLPKTAKVDQSSVPAGPAKTLSTDAAPRAATPSVGSAPSPARPRPVEAPARARRSVAEAPEGVADSDALVPSLLALAIHLFVQATVFFLSTLLVLIPVCRYWDVDMFASGYLLSSLANAVALAVVTSVVSIVVPMHLPPTMQMILVSIVAVPTLVFTVRHFSFNRDFGASVRVALMANACSFALMIAANGVFLGIALALARKA